MRATDDRQRDDIRHLQKRITMLQEELQDLRRRDDYRQQREQQAARRRWLW
jgi:protein-arginine kinase activator protein McsA